MELRFPQDHGPHNDFLTEWWYYTGNLSDEKGSLFGYQLTFFRRALTPEPVQPVQDDRSTWRTSQAYSVHFALTDVSGGNYSFVEELSRGSALLAGASAGPFKVWLNQYQVEEQLDGSYLLDAAADGISLSLKLRDAKGPVLHGIQGYSQKGEAMGNASYYISQSRLASQGTISIAGVEFSVEGLSWMDHEFSTSALSPGQVGWDWFSIQLDDSSELMLYQLRNEDGSIDPYSSGTLISPEGRTTELDRDDFVIRVLDDWKSPHSKALYPSEWQIEIPSVGLVLTLNPLLADQELRVSITYWEGAVSVGGIRNGVPVRGSGYVELTGYAGSIAGRF